MEYMAIKPVSTKKIEPLRKQESDNEFLEHLDKQKDMKNRMLEDSYKSGAELSYSIHWTLTKKPEVQLKESLKQGRRGN